jgi:sugar lactone lactonase YvrE
MSNGIDWSPDGLTTFYADSIAGTVTRYPWDADRGRLGPGTVIIALDPADGLPDGLTVDDEGTIWLAVWGAGQVRRYDPTGRPLAALTFPTPQITSCVFGGAHRNRLFVTSARTGLAPDHPGFRDGGALFVIDVAATGPPPTPFGPVRGRGE